MCDTYTVTVGMCDTCTVTVTACWIKCWKSILLLSLAGTIAKAAPGSCINQMGLEQITAKRIWSLVTAVVRCCLTALLTDRM